MEKEIENNLDISTPEISDVDNMDMDAIDLDNSDMNNMGEITSDMVGVNIDNIENTEIGMSEDYQFNSEYKEQNGGGTGVVVLTIVIIVCVILGIFLGILAGKRSANK